MDFEMTIIFAVAEVYVDDDISDRVKKLRIEALMKLLRILRYYHELGYMDSLIETIADKKCKMIQKATTKDQIQRFIEPRCPVYNGKGFVEDPNIIPEEELICWSSASLKAPLNSIGLARYKEVFSRVFPDIAKEVIPHD